MISDPYQEVSAIAGLLDKTGLRDHADQLRSALAEGVTGTEIYMILRWRLANIAQDLELPPELKNCLLLLHDYLDRALGP